MYLLSKKGENTMQDNHIREDAAEREDIIAHSACDAYTAPQEPTLRERLSWFQDQKLALMVHWGPYSQLGLCESWPLSEMDAPWSREDVDWEADGEAFRAQYFGLNKTFNPIRFQPEVWADFAEENGFRYLIFTTKHHDGFAMYDTRLSEYRVTAPDCPFHANSRADITRHLFDAFRERGLGIAAYFSKADWHCPWYWAQGQKLPVAHWRNPTYSPLEKPDLWEKFVQFTHGQMLELVTRYGPLDILWLDGGQVNPRVCHQDIRMHQLAEQARRVQPNLLIADRTVGGPYENYITPEQSIPDKPILVPWESCITIGTSFSFRYDDDYKSPRELVRLLTETVAKGGNLALNIGAQPDGRLPRHAMRAAQGMGEWLRAHGRAIYGTRACAPFVVGQFAFTQRDAEVFAILRLAEGETLAPDIVIPYTGTVARVLTLDGQPLAFAPQGGGLAVSLPPRHIGTSPLAAVYVIQTK